jgi:transposase-like protein
VRGKRGRGAYGKTIVFGLLKRHGKVYTEIVPNCSRATLQGIIRGRVEPDMVDIGFDKHFSVHHGENEFANGDRHINGIESFWSYAKRRMAKFNGIPKHTFYLHLKETEYRFNHRRDNIYLEILKLLRNKPL